MRPGLVWRTEDFMVADVAGSWVEAPSSCRDRDVCVGGLPFSASGNLRQGSHFLTSTENDLAFFRVSGEFVDQSCMGFGVVESELR
jgi:hypothetical protein